MPLTQFKGKKSKHTKKTPKKKKTRRKLKQRKLQKSAVIRSGQLIRKALLEELGRPPALQEVQQVHELTVTLYAVSGGVIGTGHPLPYCLCRALTLYWPGGEAIL